MKKITLRTPGDVVNAVPHLLGYAPTESIVVIAMCGRTMTARIDLPATPDGAEATIGVLVAPLASNEPSQVLLLAHTRNDALADHTLRLLADAFEAKSIPTSLRLQVDGDFFRRIGTADWEVVPSDQLIDAPAPEASREAIARTFTPTEAVEPAPAGVSHALTVMAIIDSTPMPTVMVAHALLYMSDPAFRDTLATAITPENARPAATQLTELVRRSPEGCLREYAASLCALAWWVGGDGCRAWCALEYAGSAELGALVARVLTAGVPPTMWSTFRGDFLAETS